MKRANQLHDFTPAGSWLKMGFLSGLFLGLGLFLLHVHHNQLVGIRDVLVLQGWFMGLYTILLTCYFFGFYIALRIGRGVLGRLDGPVFEYLLRWTVPDGYMSLNLALYPLLLFPGLMGFLYQLPVHRSPFATEYSGVVQYVVLLTIGVIFGFLVLTILLGQVVLYLGRLGRKGVFTLGLVAPVLCFLVAMVGAMGGSIPDPVIEPIPPIAKTNTKILELGFDGATWRVLTPLMEAGELPNFKRLVDDGVSGELHTIEEANSAIIWNTIHTGKTPDQHGIRDFYNIQLPGMLDELYPVHRSTFREITMIMDRMRFIEMVHINATMARTRPVWDLLSAGGYEVGVTSGYMTWPADQGVNGFIISNDAFRNINNAKALQRMVYPADRIPQFQAQFPDPNKIPHELVWKLNWLESVIDTGQPDYMKVFVHNPDPTQHKHWSWVEPEFYADATTRDRKPEDNPVHKMYKRMDKFLGRLLDKLDPDTNIVILSDHGFGALFWGGGDKYGRIEGAHRWGPPGILIMHGPLFQDGVVLEDASVYDIVPTTLSLMGMPVGADMTGKVLTEAITPVFLGEHPVQQVATYEDQTLEQEPRTREQRPDNQKTLNELDALGYF